MVLTKMNKIGRGRNFFFAHLSKHDNGGHDGIAKAVIVYTIQFCNVPGSEGIN